MDTMRCRLSLNCNLTSDDGSKKNARNQHCNFPTRTALCLLQQPFIPSPHHPFFTAPSNFLALSTPHSFSPNQPTRCTHHCSVSGSHFSSKSSNVPAAILTISSQSGVKANKFELQIPHEIRVRAVPEEVEVS